MSQLQIDGVTIGKNTRPYLIAEVSANHNGSIDKAKECITAAARAGASAVKIQTYTADTMTIDSDTDDFLIKKGLWKGKTLYELYGEACTPFEWHAELFKHASEQKITLFSSPFDETAVDLLESLNTPAYKVASFELIDLPLISYIAGTGKPILMSTGMASKEEIRRAVDTAKQNGSEQIGLFHCISGYPTPLEEANLMSIQGLSREFDLPVGLSDHTIGNTAAIVATGLGATFFEKHFTLDRNDPGPDSAFSIEPEELTALRRNIDDAHLSIGTELVDRTRSESEKPRIQEISIFCSRPPGGGDYHREACEAHPSRFRFGAQILRLDPWKKSKKRYRTWPTRQLGLRRGIVRSWHTLFWYSHTCCNETVLSTRNQPNGPRGEPKFSKLRTLTSLLPRAAVSGCTVTNQSPTLCVIF